MKDSKNLTMAAYDSIKQMMLDYDIVPGQRLVFVDLAKQLGVSRTPVNNALCLLAKEGYLDFVPHQGYSVHKLDREEAEALYEIREVLELGTISKAIRKMTKKDLSAFSKRKKEYEKAITGHVHRKLFILDMEFHGCMIDILGNPYLSERYRELCRKIFLRFRVEDLKAERVQEIAKEHEKLFEAVSVKDVERAKELIKAHNTRAKANLFEIIFRKDTGKILT